MDKLTVLFALPLFVILGITIMLKLDADNHKVFACIVGVLHIAALMEVLLWII